MQQNRQLQTPLLTALLACSHRPDAAFYAPGHKRGQGISAALVELMGDSVFRADLPELPELDNLFSPQSVIQQAQQLAAEVFGAEFTWFLANGSTCGIQAAILATCQPGDKIILPRNIHQSAIAALILSGAVPIFVLPEYDPCWGIAHSLTWTGVESALAQHPDTKAVMLVYPTYYGVCGQIAAIAQLVHQYHIPLLVDEAHGAHFQFHPNLPRTALDAGADLAVQSTHKVLGAMTQAAMLHLRSAYIDPQRLQQALQLVQSTSPSYLLLASLDAARQQMALQGHALMTRTLELATYAREELSRLDNLAVLSLETDGHTPGFTDLDCTRLTVGLAELGLTGYEADELLRQQWSVTAELPTANSLTFILSLGNTRQDVEQLLQALRSLSQDRSTLPPPLISPVISPAPPVISGSLTDQVLAAPSLTPRAAFFAATETVPLEAASDRLCAELICPYPPGIPLLLPGEQITPALLEHLHFLTAQKTTITGCADLSLQTLKVIRPSSES
jgi:arginine decarboxylase